MVLKFGRYWIGVGRTFVVQTKAPTTVRRFLFFWLFREARPQDVDRQPRFPIDTRMDYEGRSYRYARAGGQPPAPADPAGNSASGRSK